MSFEFSPSSRARWAAALLPCLLVALLLAAPAAGQSFQGLGFLEPPSEAVDVSADGTVVIGTSRDTDNWTYVVRWINGEISPLFPTPDFGPSFRAGGTSADGSFVVGQGLYTPSFIYRRAFRWSDNGAMDELGTLLPPEFSGGSSGAAAVSADGQVVVGTSTSQTPSGWTRQQAFRWQAGTMEGLGTLDPENEDVSVGTDVSADGTVVVGYSSGEAFRWEAGVMTGLGFLPDGSSSRAHGVSADGAVVVGQASIPQTSNTQVFKASRWTAEGGIQELPSLPGAENLGSNALATSADGSVVVGQSANPEGGTGIAFIWTETEGIRPIKEVLETDYELDLEGWQLWRANSISSDGTVIVGDGKNPDGDREAWAVGLPIANPLVVNATTDGEDTNLSDEICDSDATQAGGQCSLRAALQEAAVRAGRDSISFAIEGTGPHTITVGEALPAVDEPLVLDATTQEGYAGIPLVEVTGSAAVGLDLTGGQTTVRGLALGGFTVAGVRMTGPGQNRLEASHLGVGAGGSVPLPNGTGLLIEDSPENVIGGPDPARRNVISGNAGPGVALLGAGSVGNVVAGNYVGTDAGGTGAVGNGATGVVIDGAPGNTVGGGEEGAGNVIAANGQGADEDDGRPGVLVTGVEAAGTVVAANYIGTNAGGTGALGNAGTGVTIDGAPATQVGGISAAERNVISGNGTHGVLVQGAEAAGTQITGNYVGVGANGTTALPNGTDATFRTGHHGVVVASAPTVTIGGTGTPGTPPGNVIAANAAHGIYAVGSLGGDGPADDLQVLGNYVGVDATGNALLAHGEAAILVEGAVRTAQIGQAGAGNVIATADFKTGIDLLDLGETEGAPNGTQVAGNTLGFNAGGSAVLGEMLFGISASTEAEDGGTVVTVGGEEDAAGNRILATIGVLVEGLGSEASVVASNVIGLKANGELAQAERDAVGILIRRANKTQLLGNAVAGQLIGVVLGSNENEAYLNRIGTNPAGTAKRPNTVGLFIPGTLDGTVSVGDSNKIGGVNQGNVISGNDNGGIRVGGDFELPSDENAPAAAQAAAGRSSIQVGTALANTGTASTRTVVGNPAPKTLDSNGAPDENEIAFNLIGTNASGTAQLGNGRAGSADEASAGVEIFDGAGNQLLGNVISGNGGGVSISIDPTFEFDGQPQGTVLAGNVIGANQSSTLPLHNQYGSVTIIGSPGNVLTTLALEETEIGNDIWGAGEFGGVGIRLLEDGDVGNKVRGASFFVDGGPSINLLDADLEYPSQAPSPPNVFSAAATDAFVRLRYSPGTTGTVEAFSSDNCDAGHADGVFVGAFEASGGPQNLEIGYESLPFTGPATALWSYLAVTVTEPEANDMTSAFSDCIRVTQEENLTEVPVEDTETDVVLDDVDLLVEITENPPNSAPNSSAAKADGTGTLFAARYDTAPEGNAFEGSAPGPDGTTVVPTTVATSRYWSLAQDGVGNVTYTACLTLSGVSGINDPGRLVLLQRANQGRPWTPFASTLEADGTRLCAAGLTAFGELGIGGDVTENPLPVELAGFKGTLDGKTVRLEWQTATETNNAGFHVERAVKTGGPFEQIGFVKGTGTSTDPDGGRDYRFADRNLPFEAERLTYRLRQIDTDGTATLSGETILEIEAPETVVLHGVFPHPVQARATLRYELVERGPVRIELYDLLGRRVQTLVNGEQPAGRHESTIDASRLPSGVYFYRLSAGSQVRTERVVVQR